MCDYLFVLFCFGVCDLLYVFCFIGAIPYHMKSTLECHTVHEESVRLNKLMWGRDVTRCDMILLLFGNKLMWGRHVTWCTFGEDETVNYTRRFNELIRIRMEGMNVNNSGYSTVICRQKHQSPSAVSQEHLIITTRTCWYDIHGVLFHLCNCNHCERHVKEEKGEMCNCFQ